MREPFADVLVGTLANMTERLVDVVPKLSVLALFVGLGALGAWAVAGLAQAALRAGEFDRTAIRWGLWRVLQAGGIRRSPTDVLAGVLGGFTFAIAALLALDGIEMPGARPITAAILDVLPRAVGAALVMILGTLMARLGRFGAHLAWTRRGWDHAEIAGRGAGCIVAAAAGGFALAVLGVSPVAILVAPAVPLALIGLGAILGLAHAAYTLARDAATRGVRSLWLSRGVSPSSRPARAEAPESQAVDTPDPFGVEAEAFARFNPPGD